MTTEMTAKDFESAIFDIVPGIARICHFFHFLTFKPLGLVTCYLGTLNFVRIYHFMRNQEIRRYNISKLPSPTSRTESR